MLERLEGEERKRKRAEILANPKTGLLKMLRHYFRANGDAEHGEPRGFRAGGHEDHGLWDTHGL